MPGRDFYPTNLSFSKLGFVTDIKMSIKRHNAIFWYLHHALRIGTINEELKKAGLRPMTADELKVFFRVFGSSLQTCQTQNFIITDPQSVINEGEKKYRVPAIFRNNDNEPVMGFSPELGASPEDIFLADHTWIVLAVEDVK